MPCIVAWLSGARIAHSAPQSSASFRLGAQFIETGPSFCLPTCRKYCLRHKATQSSSTRNAGDGRRRISVAESDRWAGETVPRLRCSWHHQLAARRANHQSAMIRSSDWPESTSSFLQSSYARTRSGTYRENGSIFSMTIQQISDFQAG